MMPQDLFGFFLTLFSNLKGMGYKCVTWVSSANLYFTSFLTLFTLTNTEFNFSQVGALFSDAESQFWVAYEREQVGLKRIRELEQERCPRRLAEEEHD